MNFRFVHEIIRYEIQVLMEEQKNLMRIIDNVNRSGLIISLRCSQHLQTLFIQV